MQRRATSVLAMNLAIAIGALRQNLLRSLLTTLGISIGVAAVIAVVSIVQGLESMITKELEGVGATYVQVLPRQGRNLPGWAQREPKLTWEDGLAIRAEVADVHLITPLLIGAQKVRYRGRSYETLLLGVNQDFPEVLNFRVETGRFISHVDILHRRKVAVIGLKVIDELRLGDEPIGREIYAGEVPVTIIGVMEPKGQSLGADYDTMVLIPFETSVAIFGRKAREQIQLRIQTRSAEVVEEVKENVVRLLRRRHQIEAGGEDDFDVQLQDEVLKRVDSILGSVTLVAAAVVGVALLVGGIGIMNIMLVSVTERTREIGLRKSIGARRHDVLQQFLLESVMLALVGGLTGLVAGYGLGALVAALIPNWPPVYVPWWSILLALGFASLVGVFFGIYPANRAARLDPIEALRYE